MKKNWLLVALAALCVLLFIALSITITYRIAVEPMKNQIAQLQVTLEKIEIQNTVKEETKIVASQSIPKDGQDGKTPPCYYEANQCRGMNGKDSVSTTIETKSVETIIKEQQVAQPYKDIQFNPSTCAIETKMSNEKFWEVVVQLNPSVVQCLISVQSPLRPVTGLVEL